MGKDGIEGQEITLPPGAGQGGVRGKRGALQKIQKVLFSCTAPEGLGYVPANEKGL